MQIIITPPPKPNTILFCEVDCFEFKKVKNKTVKTKACSLNMIMGTEEMTLSRIHKKFPKVKPDLIEAKILKEWEK